MLWTLVPVVVAVGLGGFIVELVWPMRPGEGLAGRAMRLFLGVGIGYGATSSAALLFVLIRGRFSTSLRSYELMAFAVLALVLWKRRHAAPAAAMPRRPGLHWDLPTLLGLALALASIATVTVAVLRFGRAPFGDWDAWAIYNLRARMLYRGGWNWREAFTGDMSWSHPDYPLLVPLAVVRGWVYAGGENALAPGLLGPLFGAATVGLVTAVVSRLRGGALGAVAGLVILGNVALIRNATGQMADVPLMFFMTAAIAMLALRSETTRESEGAQLLALAGVTAALAAWTKNEGALFVVVFAFAHLATATRAEGWRATVRSLVPFAAGALPVLLVLLYFKVALAPSGTLALWQEGPSLLARLTDPTRYALIAREFATRTLLYRGPGVDAGHVLLLYAIFAFMMPARHATWLPGALTLVLLWMGYFVVYVTTPFELGWHVATSMDRLLLQTWPALVLVVMLRGPSAEALVKALRPASASAAA